MGKSPPRIMTKKRGFSSEKGGFLRWSPGNVNLGGMDDAKPENEKKVDPREKGDLGRKDGQWRGKGTSKHESTKKE